MSEHEPEQGGRQQAAEVAASARLLSEEELCQLLGGRDLKAVLSDYERRLVLEALAKAGGHQRQAAALLGILPSTLHEKMKRLDIPRRGLGQAWRETVSREHPAFHWHGRMEPGATLEIEGGPLRLEVETIEGRAAEILATRAAAPAGDIEVDVSRSGDRLVVRVTPLGALTSAGPVAELLLRLPNDVRLVSRAHALDPAARP